LPSYVYTPPALTQDRLLVFERCVNFVRSHEEHKDLWLNMQGDVRFGKHGFSIKPLYTFEKGLDAFFSKSEIADIEAICKGLRKSECVYAFRKDNIVLFCSFSVFFFGRPGVAYSLYGENPNDIDNEDLNKYKPFLRIRDDWYMSRKLHVLWRRTDLDKPISVPKSLIDHSLKIDKAVLVQGFFGVKIGKIVTIF